MCLFKQATHVRNDQKTNNLTIKVVRSICLKKEIKFKKKITSFISEQAKILYTQR